MKTKEPKTTSAFTDTLQGRAKIAVGAVKKEVGKVVGSKSLKASGAREEREGRLQKKIGEIKRVFSD